MAKRLRCMGLLARETIREVLIHNRWFHVCVWGLLIFVLAGRFLTDLPLGSSAPKLLYDLGQGTIMSVSGTVLIILLSYHLLNELDTGAAQTYLVRRVSRGDYLVGKLLGCWLAVVLLVFLADGLLAVLVAGEMSELIESGDLISALGITGWLQLFLFQLLHLLILASLTVLLVSISTSFLFAALSSLLLWSAGLLMGAATDLSGSLEGLGGFFIQAARFIIPRFEVWDVSNSIWYAGTLPVSEVLRTGVFGLLYGSFLILLAIVCFNRRDL
ncbi:MAG: hypothetical protein O7C75_17245 [Verrucomicrobia bacterium]|nr:hypothetical protein [Verrucomicrobiota bacterium]